MAGASKQKARVSIHHSRDGVAVHNDRTQCDLPNIDKSRSCDNIYWRRNPEVHFDNFEDFERACYEQNFAKWLDKQNAKYSDKRNYDRIKTMDEIYDSNRYKPEETILQIGDEDTDVDPKVFEKCIREYMKWEQQWTKENGVKFIQLDWAIHADETSLHCHERGIFVATDEDGNLYPAQDKCLDQAGICLPDEEKKRGSKNNRKMTFDAVRREAWMDIVEKYSEFEVIRTPIKKKKAKQSQEEMIQEKVKTEEKLDEIKVELENLQTARDKVMREIEDWNKTKGTRDETLEKIEDWNKAKGGRERELRELEENIEAKKKEIEELDNINKQKRKFADKIDAHETVSDSVDDNKKRSRGENAADELSGINAL